VQATLGPIINVRSCRPIRHVVGCYHSSCLQTLGNLHTRWSGVLVQLLGDLQQLLDCHIDYRLDCREVHGPAERGLDIHHIHLVGIVVGVKPTQVQYWLQIQDDQPEIERGLVRWRPSIHQKASSRHFQVGYLGDRCNAD
jgi:hypothetical protein